MSKWTYLGHNMKRWTFFVKPDEQCRVCSNMVMARKRTISPSTYNEEKVKRTFLCFICSYVKMDVFRSQYEKMNVFVKPDEQCRACSNMVMARKERLAPSTYNEEKVKRTSLCLLCSYVKKDLFRSTLKLLSEPPTYVLMSKGTYLGRNTKCWTITPFTYPLVYPSTRQFANLPKSVNLSARILTQWVPFLSTNRPPCRKKTILARVCFDAKRG